MTTKEKAPTPWAYQQACNALHFKTEQLKKAEDYLRRAEEFISSGRVSEGLSIIQTTRGMLAERVAK